MGGSQSTPTVPPPAPKPTASPAYTPAYPSFSSPVNNYSSYYSTTSGVTLPQQTSRGSTSAQSTTLAATSAQPTPHGRPTPSVQSLLPGLDHVSIGTAKVGSASTASSASPATVNVTHDVHDYVVEKAVSTNKLVPDLGCVPRSSRCDRHILRVCNIYNQRNFVCQKFCHRFHVCLKWINGQCNSNSCDCDHSFNSTHNQMLTQYLVDQRFSEDQLKEQLKKNVDFGRRARSKYETGAMICSHYLAGRCVHQNCRNIHMKQKFSWEIQDGTWVRLPDPLNQSLEEAYCDPSKDEVTLTLETKSDSSDQHHLSKIFGQNGSTGDFDFRSMTFRSSKMKIFQVRRLSTPSDIFANMGTNTRWLWFLESQYGSPTFLTHGETDKFYQLALSDCLERALQNGESEVRTRNGNIYDLVNMNFMQYGMRLIRRPAKILSTQMQDNKPIHFRKLWNETISNGVFSVDQIAVGSNEYIFVDNIFRTTLSGISIHKIFRIQNSFLWDDYQLKKKKMVHLFKGDVQRLKEQYMFHGTKASVLDKIYEGNLDWRLYGTNVGCVYGRGTYFSNQARVSHGYASGSPKVILLAMVLVGDACVGNKSMDYPPKNPATNMHYDTTVNSTSNPTIFVKYNDDEYYPAYAVYYD
ncbi:protein mono-ADP-ribosyltransferase PARP12-like isoform X2 [Hyalella azteca]|uniref:Protein mono-ADP-ribosyltransferase PARP12-like isoform X2 n=1 Tax=Hyalella azteca TaxID=294128 RepID=A0A8B7NUB8_HYAAZ|nr:protein mono-ADP-ribosyltransferase PARP12-like isoform X2 [Hyalella azteca]